MQTARDVVLELLKRWVVLAEPPFLPERSDETFAGLSPRDRPFAFDLLTGVIRWRKCVDAVIASRLRQPIETLDHALLAVLWLGAYQLLFQGGTADYAAVDTTVDLAKKHRETAKAGGLVNAVLRGITRLNPTIEPRVAGTAGLSRRVVAVDFERQIKFAEDVFLNPGGNPIGHLAAVRSHPAPYVEHLRNLYGDVMAGDLLLRNNLRPVVTLRADAGSVDVPATAGLVAHAQAARFLVAKAGWNQTLEELVRKGILSPQDPTSAKPVRYLEGMVLRGELAAPARLLDLCAGLGTKSLQLARAFPEAQVTAADIDSVKLARLQSRVKPVGQKNVVVAEGAAAFEAAKFEVVLVDVPCSNTGVMAKRVQSRWRWPSLDHGALLALQLKLLAEGMTALADGGLLVYSTCSIDPAENASLVEKCVETAAGKLRLLHEDATLPSLASAAEGTFDGGYFAVLKKG